MREDRFYEPGLDVLRFVAFLMVFTSHAFPGWAWKAGGYESAFARHRALFIQTGAFGVDIFFCLSAFLITTLLLREERRYGILHVGAFYIRRILRIWPLYYAFLLADIFIFPCVIGMAPVSADYRPGFFLFFANWMCALKGYSHSCVDILWSVSLEEQFYLIWPLLLYFFRVRRMVWLCLSFLVAAFTTHVFLVRHQAGHPAIWCNTLVRFEPIVVGALLAYVYAHRPILISRLQRLGLRFLALCTLWASIWLCPTLDGPWSLLTYPLAALAAGALVLSFLGCLNRSSFFYRGLIYLGKISFGLYVFHLFSLSLMDWHVWNGWGIGAPYIRALSGFLTTVILAVGSYHLLERPFLKLKSRFSYVTSRRP